MLKLRNSSRLLLILGIILIVFLCIKFLTVSNPTNKTLIKKPASEGFEWQMPDTAGIPSTEEGELIRYGRELIVHTALFLGPKGKVKQISNGMNCQNCHIDAGTVAFGNSFFAVASTYPKYRDRSGRLESIEFRINECMERSLNGQKLDSLSREMRAMVAYFKWLGKGVPKGTKPIGTGTEELTFLDRPADPEKGEKIYARLCQNCHGKNGEGILSPDLAFYYYPPLWGKNSYTVSAGMYRLTRLAGFIRNNMPLLTTADKPLLTIEESWDVAAFISSKYHPKKFFPYDWPNIAAKPVDYPFGPYTDSFTEKQHKYGPFGPIKRKRARLN